MSKKNTAFRLSEETISILELVGNRAGYLDKLIRFINERTLLAISELIDDGWPREELLSICKESAGIWRRQGCGNDGRIDTVVSQYWLGNKIVRDALEEIDGK